MSKVMSTIVVEIRAISTTATSTTDTTATTNTEIDDYISNTNKINSNNIGMANTLLLDAQDDDTFVPTSVPLEPVTTVTRKLQPPVTEAEVKRGLFCLCETVCPSLPPSLSLSLPPFPFRPAHK